MSLFRRKRKLKVDEYTERWIELQKHCANRKTWPVAIQDADKLLDDVLKRCGYKGKTLGERLVSAQHDLSSNDTIWVGHKLSNKLKDEPVDARKLKKKDMVVALSGFRQALRDLGALKVND